MALPQDSIAAKRDGAALRPAQIQSFVDGLIRPPGQGGWSEGQIAAMAMAVLQRGMNTRETATLTQAMTHSGRVLNWREQGFEGPVLDKHSTGGVGDKVSLILAPWVAECGAALGAIVPMISGRGLGHTGGTLDKLEALPGYQVNPSAQRLRRALREAGCAIVGASADISPADKRLYAIRDVTGTVPSIALIVSSILSKKLAAGLSALVLDVKVGSGAVFADQAQAQALAKALVATAKAAGLPAKAVLTDMNRVLGHSAGNALEVAEVLAFLSGEHREPDLLAVTQTLVDQLLVLGGVAPNARLARQASNRALASGAVAERFGCMVAALGGPKALARPGSLGKGAPVVLEVLAPRAGTVSGINARLLGQAVVALGGGRWSPGAAIDPRVGLSRVVKPNQLVARRQVLALVHATSQTHAQLAQAQVLQAIRLESEGNPARVAGQGPARGN